MSSPALAFAGLDLGTTAIKALAVDVQGRALARVRAPLPSPDARGRQDPANWWETTLEVLAQLGSELAATGSELELAGLGICGQAPSPVFVDADGRALGLSPTWQDRSADAHRRLLLETEAGRGAERLSLRLVAHLRALAAADPPRFERCMALQNSFDHLGSRLTDASPGCSNPPASALLAAAGLPARFADTPRWSRGQRLGVLRPDLAARTRLSSTLPIFIVGVDAFASTIGSGISRPGEMCIERGTSGSVSVVLAPGSSGRFELDPGIAVGSWATQCAGVALDWALALFAAHDRRSELLDEALALRPTHPELIFLPYLNGERAPIEDPEARGVLFGLSLSHGPAEIVRAVIEGVAFSQRHLIEACAPEPRTTARVVGGLSRVPGLDQLWSDALELRLERPRFTDTAALGAAMVAAVTAGGHASLGAAGRAMNPSEVQLEPRPDPRLAEAYALYRELYPRLTELYPRLRAGSRALDPLC